MTYSVNRVIAFYGVSTFQERGVGFQLSLVLYQGTTLVGP
jgi:hypothetical protein